MARVFAAVLAVATLIIALAVAEALTRRVDHLPLFVLHLPAPDHSVAAVDAWRERADERYMPAVHLAKDVDPAWYRVDPPAPPPIPPSEAIQRRVERYAHADRTIPFFAWNRLYLHERLCNPDTAPTFNAYDDFFVFDPPDRSLNPAYRHLSRVQVPGWFPTNRFGWRGPDLELNKPPHTIRIAFLGSSKTIDPYGAKFSHIEYLGEWLNLWMHARHLPHRVEVINAARTGISEPSIAAVLLQEVLPLEPDLVIDDGGNDFGPRLLVHVPPDVLPPAAASGTAAPWRLDAYSALSRRVHAASVRLRHLDGSEPRKPMYPIAWPADVNEMHPDDTRVPLPMQLHTLVAEYDRMRTALEAEGGTFALPSWVVMVRGGLTLSLPRDLTLFNALNSAYYPLSYAQIRRAADFDNRVFRAYAERHGLPFFDLAAQFPLDPELFGDALHKSPAGLRLESWIYLQLIAGWLDGELTRGALPRPMRHPQHVHPAFASTDYPIVPRSELQKTCP